MVRSGDGARGNVTDDQSRWYLTFISIIFGVFIAVWIEPVSALFFVADQTVQVQQLFTILFSATAGRGALIFIILICLWWWYGTFLGRIAPARSFWDYLYDFVSLSSFAVAFRMWNHPSLFPIVVFFAASLMLFRFAAAWRFTADRPLARKAIAPAIALLSLFMAGTAGGIVVYFDFSGELLNWPPWVNNSVVVLLMVVSQGWWKIGELA